MEACPCAECKTTGGAVERNGAKPRRRSGRPFGIEGMLCGRCYFRHYQRGDFVPVTKAPKELKPFLFDPCAPELQRLVVAVARRHRNRRVDLDDLVAEGQIGLMKACRKFDPSLGVAFDAHAATCIRYAILLMLQRKASLIRIPEDFHKDLKRDSGEEPRDPNYAAALKIYRCQFVNESGLEVPLESFAPARPDVSAEQNETTAKIAELLDSLPEREAKVLRIRFGFEAGSRSRTHIGKSFGVTVEAVRWMEIRAIKRLQEKMGVAS